MNPNNLTPPQMNSIFKAAPNTARHAQQQHQQQQHSVQASAIAAAAAAYLPLLGNSPKNLASFTGKRTFVY